MNIKIFRIKKKNGGPILCENAKVATSFYERLLGLMFKMDMPNCDCLILEPCSSIHTFFMKFSIDVIFVNKKNQIIKIIKNFKPWGLSALYFSSQKVLELKNGKIGDHFNVGDELEFECIK